MTLKRILGISLLVTLLVWAVFSWPQPRYLFNGIPASATNVEEGSVRRMIEGDHLQMLYNYWIFSDMLLGKTPFWHNIYEFNTGDDAERKYVGPDLIPFSAIFTLGYIVANRAFAWNLLLFSSLWISYFLTWLLVRRYTRDNLCAALGALMMIFLPYRWASMLGGSPTGISMVLTPMLFLGLDLAIRDKKLWGGVMAGLAILFAAWNDAHILFLGLLTAPGWCIIAFLANRDFQWTNWREWYRLILAMIPFVLIAGWPIFVSLTAVSEGDIENTTIEAGRTLHEVGLFCPKPIGLIEWRAGGHENSIYIGWILPTLVAIGLILILIRLLRNPSKTWNSTIAYLLTAAFSVLLIILALGINGPNDAHLFMQARGHIPHYDMIRQPAKIYALLPPLLAVLAGMAMKLIIDLSPKYRKYTIGFVLLIALALGITYTAQIRPTICLVDSKQDAYAAVAKDAAERNVDARLLVIPIWPGDSAWSSLYEHYVSLYRIRMINGYLPVVPLDYVQNIAIFHEFANVGIFPEAQLNDLKARGIEYIIFHEDAFPEKVSNFPAGFTLYKLLTNPSLQFLAQDGNVWAFRILPEDHELTPIPALSTWTTFFPTHNCFWDSEWGKRSSEDMLIEDETAFGQKAVRLTPGNDQLTLFNIPHCSAPESALLIRAKGHGTLKTEILLDNQTANIVNTPVSTDAWQWVQVSAEPLGNSSMLQPRFSCTQGDVELDAVMSFAGKIPDLKIGDTWTIPAPLFFHAGYTDLDHNSVNLRPDYQSGGGRWGVFYGPKIPLPPGTYQVTINFTTPAPDGTPMGSFYVQHDGTETPDFPVVAGQPATGTFTNHKAYPINVPFTYARKAPMEIFNVVFKKIGD